MENVYIEAPTYLPAYHNDYHSVRVFLAGSIEMGVAEHWQDEVAQELLKLELPHDKRLVIANPRRKDWDSSWKQDINDAKFFE